MTVKERWLATIKMQEVDRLVFWPKLNQSYAPAQSGKFAKMSLDELHDFTGSDKHEWNSHGVEVDRKNCSVEVVEKDGERKTVYKTPVGETYEVCKWDDVSKSWHPSVFPVRDRETLKTMTEFYRLSVPRKNTELAARGRMRYRELGDDVFVVSGSGESPLMRFVEWLAGVENAHFMLLDYEDDVEELFDAMQAMYVKICRLACETESWDMMYFSENTSTTLISPDQYRKYCVGHITEYGNIFRAAGRNFGLHMCGHLKALLPDLAKLPADAFEAFTSPTLGNTTLLDGRSECPDKCLIGGTNAMLWTKSANEIIAQIEQSLGELPHHRGIAVTSAGVMPPLCKPETIKEVCEWVKRHPARMNEGADVA